MSSTKHQKNSGNSQKVINILQLLPTSFLLRNIQYTLNYFIPYPLLPLTFRSISFSKKKKKKKITISNITVFYKWIPRLTENFSPGADSLLKFFHEITVRNPLVHLLLFLCSTIKGTRRKEREREFLLLPSNTDTLRFRFSCFGLYSDGPLLRLNFKLWKKEGKNWAHTWPTAS